MAARSTSPKLLDDSPDGGMDWSDPVLVVPFSIILFLLFLAVLKTGRDLYRGPRPQEEITDQVDSGATNQAPRVVVRPSGSAGVSRV